MEITAVIQENSSTSIVKWNSEKLLNCINSVKLAFIPSKDLDLATRKKIEKRLERKEIKIDGTSFVVYHDKSVKIHDPPMSGSPGSSAKYYVWDDNTGLLLQFIPKNSRTSCNFHKKTNERFYNVVGDCSVCFCNGKNSPKGIKLDRLFSVKPHQCHQVHTSSVSAINMILMNPPNLGRSDHHYLKKCIKQL